MLNVFEGPDLDKIKGVGDVLAGRVEQGVVKPNEEVIFLPTYTASNPCAGKVSTVEMHLQRADFANPGDNVGLNIKGLDKQNMPRSGDVMVYMKGTTLGQTSEFAAQIQVLAIPMLDRATARSRFWPISTTADRAQAHVDDRGSRPRAKLGSPADPSRVVETLTLGCQRIRQLSNPPLRFSVLLCRGYRISNKERQSEVLRGSY